MALKKSLFQLADKALSIIDSSADIPCATEPNDQEFFWTLRNLPIEFATQNMAVIGGIGSGKTTLIQLLLQSIAHRFKPDRAGRPEQLIIYDAKTEVIPLLEAAGLSTDDPNFWILNPLDQRSAAWAMAEAVQQPAYARALSRVLAPREEKSTAPFFANGASILIKEIMAGLSAIVGSTWSFRDLLCALGSPKQIRAIAAHNPRSSQIVGNILNDSKHADGIISTLMTKLQDFEEVAALWHTSSEKKRVFSIDTFFRKPGVLVLGFDSELQDALWPANRAILNAITQKILNQGDSPREPRFWFLLDEFPAMGDMKFVSDLMNRGRSKGASVLLGAQTISGLHAIYEKPRTEEILGDCTFKTFLQSSDPITTEWMSSVVGTLRYWEENYSESHKGEITVSHKVEERRALNESVFKFLPRADSGSEFHAVHVTPKGPLYSRTWADEIFAMRWAIPDQSEFNSAIQRRENVADQFLEPWSPAEELWFCRPRSEPADLLPEASGAATPVPITDVTLADKPAPEKARTQLRLEPKPWKRPILSKASLEELARSQMVEESGKSTRLPPIKTSVQKTLPGLDRFEGEGL